MLILDQNFLFFPMVHFFFAVSLILCTGKWIKLFTEAVLIAYICYMYRTKLTGKPSAPFKRAFFGLEKALRFYIYFVFVHDFCL
jgi:hypothetical protein